LVSVERASTFASRARSSVLRAALRERVLTSSPAVSVSHVIADLCEVEILGLDALGRDRWTKHRGCAPRRVVGAAAAGQDRPGSSGSTRSTRLLHLPVGSRGHRRQRGLGSAAIRQRGTDPESWLCRKNNHALMTLVRAMRQETPRHGYDWRSVKDGFSRERVGTVARTHVRCPSKWRTSQGLPDLAEAAMASSSVSAVRRNSTGVQAE